MRPPLQARLLSSRDLGPEIREFLFEVPELERLEFTPGQFVSFTGAVAGRQVTRAYSIASRPDGNRFELCLNRVKEGHLSPWLFALQPGGAVAMQGPLGGFVPRTPFRDSVFVAVGTGIAPFRSYLHSERILKAECGITLLFGARYEAGLLYRGEFEQLARRWQRFVFMPTLTRPDAAWTGRTGRVQQHLAEALAGRRGIDVYICGLKAMVNDVRALLLAQGFERKQIVAERYD